MSPDQVSDAELSEASRRGDHAQIEQWRREGSLADLLAGRDPGHPEEGDESELDEQLDPTPVGDVDQGARSGPNLGQLSDDDVKALYARGAYGEIDRARREGRLDQLLGRR